MSDFLNRSVRVSGTVTSYNLFSNRVAYSTKEDNRYFEQVGAYKIKLGRHLLCYNIIMMAMCGLWTLHIRVYNQLLV